MIIDIVLVVVILVSIIILSGYNKFIKLENYVKESVSGIDILLKKRFDLIPNLIETVKGYASHENSTFTEVAELRSNYEKTNNLDIETAEKIDGKIRSILALSESYPDLKANIQFLELQKKLFEIEEQLNVARIRYNSRVTRFNNQVGVVPSNIIAKIFGFKKMELFKIENENERNNTKVSF